MKKIFIFSAFVTALAGVIPSVAHADKQSCQIRETDTCDNDNEYLSVDGVRGCYVCEKGKCVTGDLVVATNASLNGKKYRNYKFRCQLGWDDQWIGTAIPNCAAAKWQRLKDDEHASQKIINPNTGEPMFNDNSSQVVTGADPCLAWICDKGYVDVNGECVNKNTPQPAPTPAPQPQPQPEPTPAPQPQPTPTPTPAPQPAPAPRVSCRDGRTTITGKACCDTGRLGTYNKATDTCTCQGDLDFVIENGTGFCRAKSTAPSYTCPAAQLTWVANLKITCGSNTEIQSQIAMIENYCKGTGVSETAFNEYITQLMTLSAQLCNASSTPSAEEQLCDKISDAHMVGDVCKCDDEKKELNRVQMRCVNPFADEQEAARTRITSISSKISNLRAGLSTSVWKDKEGNFNTSRLISDSVAGVVLGTAGGIITSNVIKKNQLKGGFEDINCTIRGQVVAGYGDDFQVGMQ